MALFRKEPKDPFTAEEAWAVYEGADAGLPLMARFNTGLKRSVGHPDYGIRIGIAVPFNDATEFGFPATTEHERLHQVEEQIEALARGRAVLAGVITTGGMREFILYTSSGEWIEGFHQALRSGVATHEVQMIAETDPNWELYRMFVR